MNKKITIYELLGLVKDGQAPKKIKYQDKVYHYFHNMVDLHKYETMPTENRKSLSLILDNEYLNLNDEVEILEEEKKIEKLDIEKMSQAKKWKRDKKTWQKVNEIIDILEKEGFCKIKDKNSSQLLEIVKLQQEIDRLNNIIEELEKDLNEAYDELHRGELVNGRELINSIYQCLKELKEDNK